MPPTCQRNVDLFAYNTLAVHASAQQLWVIDTRTSLLEWYQQHQGASFLVLGGGSNIVFAGDVETPVLLNRISGRKIEQVNTIEALITAGAGENWHEFVVWTIQNGWFGLENLALIPGTVGASPIQNIGAYGVEMCQRFQSLEALDTDTGQWITLTAEDCHFGYRHSLFKEAGGGRYIVSSVTFRLSAKPALVLDYGDIRHLLKDRELTDPTPMDVCEAVQYIRRQKLPDPAVEPNAGSFFKNPVLDEKAFALFIAAHPDAIYYALSDGRYKLAAGWLIDKLGWKGKQLGPVTVNQRQALVLINQGGTGMDIIKAAQTIARDVYGHFGVVIEMEPRVVGHSSNT